MWNRADLKARAKYAFKQNYWKCVLVSLLFMLVAGGSRSSALGSSSSDDSSQSTGQYYEYDDGSGILGDLGQSESSSSLLPSLAILGMSGVVLFVVLLIFIALDVCLFNPLEVGCDRFFARNLYEPVPVGNIGFAFDSNYGGIVKTMFLRDLYTFLWSLLLIIPGIVKRYEYLMVPYLLAEDRWLTTEQAFAESKQMMDGQKWNAFVLDLSFIGWEILSAMTLGILGIFYVNPYVNMTNAALYDTLRYGNPQPQQDMGQMYGY
jgi:uncharacterized membrane protein